MKLGVLIVAADASERREIVEVLSGLEDCEFEIEESGDGESIGENINGAPPSLLILDADAEQSWVDDILAARTVAGIPFLIVLSRNNWEASRAFELSVSDFILKPLNPDRLRDSIQRVVRVAGRDAVQVDLISNPSAIEPRSKYPGRLAVRDGKRVVLVKTTAIDWAEACSNYVELHGGGTCLLMRGTLKSLEQKLPPNQFIRLGRSIIVNVDRIREVRTISKGKYAVILEGGQELPLQYNLSDLRSLLEQL